jgi:Fe-S cluster assembly protein SufD
MSARAETAAARAAVPASPILRAIEAQWRSREPGPLHELREAALHRFLLLGIPTSSDESWRHTSLRSLAAADFAAAPDVQSDHAGAGGSELADVETLHIANGIPRAADLSRLASAGFDITPLGTLSRSDPALLRRFLQATPDAAANAAADPQFADEENRFALLNTALFLDGIYIRFPGRISSGVPGEVSGAADRKVPPLRILHLTEGPGASHPRVIIDLQAGAAATVIEHHVSGSETESLCNAVTQVIAADGAQLEHYRVLAGGAQASHIDTLDLCLGKDSRCTQYTLCIGGALVRTTLDARLQAPGASLDSYALLMGHESRHADCVNVVTHAARDTSSRQTARAVAAGESRVVLNSKVIVRPGAARSESMQSCRGLLMSADAEIDTRPQLEIHADEVKCAHGATTGRLDPDMLFYLLSRGLDRATAQSLLVYAFLADVLTGMSAASTREAVDAALIAQLPESQLLEKFR